MRAALAFGPLCALATGLVFLQSAITDSAGVAIQEGSGAGGVVAIFAAFFAVLVLIIFSILYGPLFCWLIVPTLTSLKLLSRRARVVSWLALIAFAGLVAIAASPMLLWIAMTAIIVALTAAPGIRGVAWLITPVTFVGVLLFLGTLATLAFSDFQSQVVPLAALTCILLVAATRFWLVLRRYAKKQMSDGTLLVTQWWFTQTLTSTLIPLLASVWNALVCMFAFGAFLFLLSAGLRRLQTTALSIPR